MMFVFSVNGWKFSWLLRLVVLIRGALLRLRDVTPRSMTQGNSVKQMFVPAVLA